ncbi:Biotin--protein ligase 1, chloroplastic [Vitis vinifera]|uniref:Biotin--protein ligase 1, chloroplastic n=1 Tax=Vitis vinifera TaxID=29760 RepID=A0A438C352_VITVI|nr:Biotin--protein ligase 1, chloroplastic [Vitis vinifera]
MITRTGSHSNQSPRISIDTRDRSALTLLLSSSQAPQRPLMLQKRRSHHFLITSDSFKGVGDRKSYATAVTITTYIVLSPKTRRCIQFRSVEVLLRAYALHEFPSLSFSTESSLLSLPSQTPSSTEEALQSISTASRIRELAVFSVSITISTKLALIQLFGSVFQCLLTDQAEFKRKLGRKFEFGLLCSLAMDSQSTSLLVLCGKSSAEIEFAKSLKAKNTLKLPDNGEVSILLHPEIEKPEEEPFQMDLFMSSLSTNTFGRFLIWSPQLPSTHDVVSQNFCELPIGTVCVADVQLKGRGRSKNKWESPRGCLLFSFTLQMEDGRTVPLLQYVVSLAITEAIKSICDSKCSFWELNQFQGLPHLDVKIKWPNDLYLNGLKVGGILCTSTYKSQKFNVSAGKLTHSSSDADFKLLKNCTVRHGYIGIDHRLFVFQSMKFLKLQSVKTSSLVAMIHCVPYVVHSSSCGQRVIVQENNEGQMVENVVTIQGLASSGYLLAIGDDGQMCELHPDGNRYGN